MREENKEIKVFICGSISIKKIPPEAEKIIDDIIAKRYEILVGDADGIDYKIQEYCRDKKYFKLTIYIVGDKARKIATSEFMAKQIKKDSNKIEYVQNSNKKQSERERQWIKDKAMMDDCDYGLIIWDGESKGSYKNLLYMIDSKKKFYLYIDGKKIQNKTKENIEKIFRENYGFNKTDLCEELKKEDFHFSKGELDKFVTKHNIKGDIKKYNKKYDKTDTRFSPKILEEIINTLKKNSLSKVVEQPSLPGMDN